MRFNKAFEKFLLSVKNKDFVTFESFFDNNKTFVAVLPQGRIFTSTHDFLENQKTFFKNNTGEFDYKILSTETSGTIGFGTIEADYKDVTAEGIPFKSRIYISFLFLNYNDQWILVHDQNTVI